MSRSHRALLAAAAAAFALLAGACSAPGPGAAGPTRPAVATAEVSDRLVIAASEFGFDRTQWAVPAGRTVDVDFANNGTIPHEWAILRRGARVETQQDFHVDMVLFEIEALPEKTSTSTRFTITEPGRYQVVCALQGHVGAGMIGTLTVVAG